MRAPINASFLDLELLGHLNPINGMPERPGCFGTMVAALREEKLERQLGRIKWVVAKNRVRAAEKRHMNRIDEALERLAVTHDFRIGDGLSERLAFRELFQFGLTHLDLGLIPEMVKPQAASTQEIARLIDSLGVRMPTYAGGQDCPRSAARVLRRTRADFRAALNAAI
ncbi:MAG: hypothetical protein GW855_03570 [Erythrobacter sp.]|nr:hypothetical protein [Erythrobacter sp.]NCQ63249.1 hypothetical protein [Alphaproteobacteria bacterium]